MKKITLVLMFLSVTLISNAQSAKLENKWYSTADVDFVFIDKYRYNYYIGDGGGRDDEVEPQGFLLKSFGAQYTFNYTFFSKLSVGALGGIQTLSEPRDFFMIKIGGVLKYFFVDRDNVYIYTQLARVISVDEKQFKHGTNGRLGIGLPVYRMDNLNINFNLFAEHTLLRLNGSDPIYGLEKEVPLDLVISSFGVSFGIQF